MSAQDLQTFLVRVPGESNVPLESFQGLFLQLHEILGPAFLGFEIIASSQNVGVYIKCRASDSEAVRSQLYSVTPACEISEAEDFTLTPLEGRKIAAAELALVRGNLLPLRDYRECAGVPFSALMSAISQCSPAEKIIVQLVVKPIIDTSFHQLNLIISRKLTALRHSLSLKYWFKRHVSDAVRKAIQEKSVGRLFQANLRVCVVSSAPAEDPQNRLEAVLNAFSSFNTLDFNQLGIAKFSEGEGAIGTFKKHLISRPFWLSPMELATLFHFPSEKDAPNLQHVLSATQAPPWDLPADREDKEITFFGETNFRGRRIPFGIRLDDRRRHLYIVGKSGSGKSKLLELLITSDIRKGHGVGVLDPHGDLVDNLLDAVPAHRVKDVIVFDPSDLSYPPSFNPLEQVPDELKMRVALGFIEVFRKLFGANWTPRLEHVLRYTTLALLDCPDTTILSIQKMLTDRAYRQQVVTQIKDKVVKNFWMTEFSSWSEKFDHEAITPLINKVGQFVATDMVRNIVGQPVNRYDFRAFMDQRKIFLMKVSKGLLGEENSSLLGAITVTKIYQAAMSRADIPEHRRTDFFLFVDEFQNFATDSFSEILSEARKYRLNLTLANQYMGQLEQKMLKTVFGNAGSLISFRVGAEDAGILANEFRPRISARDLINLGVRDFYVKMSCKGEVREPFSARTLLVSPPDQSLRNECIKQSRANYAVPLESAERQIEQGAKAGIKETADSTGFDEPIV